MRDLNVILLQLSSTPNVDASLNDAEIWTRRALDRGPDIVVLPENFWGIDPPNKHLHACDLDDPEGAPILRRMRELSAGSDALLALGGLPERPSPGDPAAASGLLYNTFVLLRRGAVIARYRKIHRFDVTLTDGSVLTESASVAPGERPLVVRTPQAALGLSICYDLRFPELYRSLVDAGAEILFIPAAFTLLTGIDHWSVLLRARAIESQCYVLAPAQVGRHSANRHSFGHSMIIDPWGTVIAQASPAPGLVSAHLDASLLARVREQLPSLRHRRLPSPPAAELLDLTAV
ncbi:MAG: carbon-nitrogen hydrolase family protein [Nannocystis sp.]|nr:carbon-nitrogen hydrolase family protein [Nannocystis sp.]